MTDESSGYYRYDGTVGRCTLTGEICIDGSCILTGVYTKGDCRSCLVPTYMWMLENKVRE